MIFDKSVVCTFLNQPPGPNIVKRCSANITYGKDCNRFLSVLNGMGTGDTVATQPLETVPGVIEYCFLVIAEANNVTVLVNGTLKLGTCMHDIVLLLCKNIIILIILSYIYILQRYIYA